MDLYTDRGDIITVRLSRWGRGLLGALPPQKFTFHMDGVAALTFSFFPWKRTKSSKNDTMILDHGH